MADELEPTLVKCLTQRGDFFLSLRDVVFFPPQQNEVGSFSPRDYYYVPGRRQNPTLESRGKQFNREIKTTFRENREQTLGTIIEPRSTAISERNTIFDLSKKSRSTLLERKLDKE